ncbi:uncharacterized protein K02A2.6-like [Penaeus indicus]|uniref:uncharacterized protein K02A2.6-like n=1 Tax=Penaeus indicus TaxID=29960 RepID=UPI00300D56D9
MLAVVFALKKFHQYTFGRLTKVISDHKPLQAIMKKPLDRAPRRLQGMLLSAFQYNIEVEYHPGKNMHVADYLSRNYLPENGGGQVFENINMLSFVPIQPTRLQKIQRSTLDDEVMNLLIERIVEGWPSSKENVACQLLPYYNNRDGYSVQNGLIFKGERIVIPRELRPEIKEAIRLSHIGVEGCLRRARECVYWPGMNPEVRQYVSQCETCNKYTDSQCKETLMTHDISDRPWDKVGVDLFELKNYNFLVTVDYFSNFWEIDRLERTSANSVIKKLKAHFARYGIPSIVVSDNGPQFRCEEFKDFARSYEFNHQTSSPHYLKSNGMAESAVKTAKKLIRKAMDCGKDPFLPILDHRNTPAEYLNLSPAQRSLGRRTRTLLPMSQKLLNLQGIDVEVHNRKKKEKSLKSAKYYNKHAKDLKPLQEGDSERVEPTILGDKAWKKSFVNRKLDERSYEVESNGGVLRRNRVHLKKTDENKQGDIQQPSVTEQVRIIERNDTEVNNNTQSESQMSDNVKDQEPKYNLRPSRNRLPVKFKDYELH